MSNYSAGRLPHLAKHTRILRAFGVPSVVGINRFADDADSELQMVEQFCSQLGEPWAVTDPFTRGGAGARELAAKVIAAADTDSERNVRPIYSLDATAEQKITTVAQQVYGATSVVLSDSAREKLRRFTRSGFSALPVCIAKTQYSLSDDPEKMGVPTGWTLHVTDILLSAGAGFLVIVSGSMLLMPGLGRTLRGFDIDVDTDGNITGLN